MLQRSSGSLRRAHQKITIRSDRLRPVLFLSVGGLVAPAALRISAHAYLGWLNYFYLSNFMLYIVTISPERGEVLLLKRLTKSFQYSYLPVKNFLFPDATNWNVDWPAFLKWLRRTRETKFFISHGLFLSIAYLFSLPTLLQKACRAVIVPCSLFQPI